MKLATAALALLVSGPAAAFAQAQTAAVNRAFDIEQAGRMRDAIAAWRDVIAAGQTAQGVLGLERVFSQLAQDDSVLPTLDSLLTRTPADKTLRGVQLRVLRSLGREADAHAAFEEWVKLAPHDPAPYREYAGELLSDGRAAAADTILRQATASLGSTKELTIEVAQLRAALGLWAGAATAWQDAMVTEEYLEQTAVYSLQAAPIAQRDSVRAVLRASTAASSKKVLGSLELQWGAARDGWRALATLTAADSAFDTWNDFAQEAARQGAWLAARDAFAAMNHMRPTAATALLAASSAISGGEPASALDLIASARSQLQPVAIRTQVLPLQVRALTQLGRAAEAEALVAHDSASLDEGTRRGYARMIAWGWIRAGEVEKARAALAGASGRRRRRSRRLDRALRRRPRQGARGAAPSDGHHRRRGDRDGAAQPHEGGQFTRDRRRVPRACARRQRTGRDAVRARGRRTSRRRTAAPRTRGARAERAPSGRAGNRRSGSGSSTQYPAAPEAAESDLEWGRTLRRKGDVAGAVDHFEHLILTYPQSALVPQARRELECRARGERIMKNVVRGRARVVHAYCSPRPLAAQHLLVPMDDAQQNHLKAYGLTFFALKAGDKAEWFLNYRGGSFLLPDDAGAAAQGGARRRDGRSRWTTAGSRRHAKEIAAGNMDAITLEKAPHIAIYAPAKAPPWDDAVTLALNYAGIEYTQIWDDEILKSDLSKFDWIHLHHEDFTGQENKLQLELRDAPWFIEQRDNDLAAAQAERVREHSGAEEGRRRAAPRFRGQGRVPVRDVRRDGDARARDGGAERGHRRAVLRRHADGSRRRRQDGLGRTPLRSRARTSRCRRASTP